MNPTKKQVALILLAVATLVIALIVLIRNRNLDVDLLAILGIIGGIAIIVVSLPGLNGNGNGGKK